MQQAARIDTAAGLFERHRYLKKPKHLCTVSKCKTVPGNEYHSVPVLVFSDARRHHDTAQLPYLVGFLIDDFRRNSDSIRPHIHFIRPVGPVWSSGDAETLAAGEGIDKGKCLKIF